MKANMDPLDLRKAQQGKKVSEILKKPRPFRGTCGTNYSDSRLFRRSRIEVHRYHWL